MGANPAGLGVRFIHLITVKYPAGREPRGMGNASMQPSMFNVQVPIAERNEVFLMNTLSDAQVLVSADVPRLIERVGRGDRAFTAEERETIETLAENGFVVPSREEERQSLN